MVVSWQWILNSGLDKLSQVRSFDLILIRHNGSEFGGPRGSSEHTAQRKPAKGSEVLHGKISTSTQLELQSARWWCFYHLIERLPWICRPIVAGWVRTEMLSVVGRAWRAWGLARKLNHRTRTLWRGSSREDNFHADRSALRQRPEYCPAQLGTSWGHHWIRNITTHGQDRRIVYFDAPQTGALFISF